MARGNLPIHTAWVKVTSCADLHHIGNNITVNLGVPQLQIADCRLQLHPHLQLLMLLERYRLLPRPLCQPVAWHHRSIAMQTATCCPVPATAAGLACTQHHSQPRGGFGSVAAWCGLSAGLCMDSVTYLEASGPHRLLQDCRNSADTLRAVTTCRQWLWMVLALLCSSLERWRRSLSARVLSSTCSLVSSPRDLPLRSILRAWGLPEKNICAAADLCCVWLLY